ncbi:MAG: hypothetical protein U1F33_03610 [Alphaproteobacteria bacterium]
MLRPRECRRHFGALLGSMALAAIALASASEIARAQGRADIMNAVTGAAVPADQLPQAIAANGVIAQLGDGGTLPMYGTDVAARERGTVYLGASSEYLFAACLDGRIEAAGSDAERGEVIVWPLTGGEARVQSFDINRFLSTSSLTIDPALRGQLEQAATAQRRKIFWGLLEPAGVNVQAPAVPAVEVVRRSYLSVPTVMRLRRESGGNVDDLARLVAESFAAGLAGRQRETVESLLSPDLFRREGQSGSDWLGLRARFAAQLLGGPLPARLVGEHVEPGSDVGTWRIVAGANLYRLRLAPLDGMLFVTAVEPEREGG